ncbi:MAG TPA: hypothetical protein VHP33_29695 [Polyangiaceae bacterium]|nr:hypothetical protein [Polyangiaceae bacterium]
MARSHLFTSLFLFASLTAGCASDGAHVGDLGDTKANEADSSAKTNPKGDVDDDGTPADQDLCPGTSAGVKVDGNGCSDEQRANGSGKGSEKGGAHGAGGAASNGGEEPGRELLLDGEVTPNGFAVFTLDPEGAVPVVFRTLESNVTKLASGFELNGTVMVDVPNDEHVTLLEAKVKLEYDSAKGTGLQSLHGSVRLPFPDIGFMSETSVKDPISAAVGYDLGKNLKEVDAPLKDDRKYLYFTFSAGLEANVGDLEISTGVNQSATMTLDVSDPAFFLKASLGGLMGPVDEASVGFSIGGHLPFTPLNTWGIDAAAASFDGHFWIGGKVNLNDVKLPLAIGGNTVYDLDPNDDGKTLFEQPKDGFQFGSNSELDLSLAAGLISFEIPIAQATITGRAGGDEAYAWYSGMTKAGNGWMPAEVPLKNTMELKTAGHASSNLDEMYFTAEGELAFDAGKLGDWTGIDLTDLALAKATLDIDKDGVLVTGTASASFSPYLGLMGNVDAVGYFNGRPEGWYVTLDGQLVVSGIDLSADAHARLDRHGMLVSGVFETPISLIDMSGSITARGVDLRGHAEVTIPIVAGKEIAQWVTDAAVCGYETVTDAAVCGYQTVTDGAKCGFNYVKDGSKCGYSYAKDGANCGYTTAASAAECGSRYVTDGAKCGFDYFDDALHCGWDCVSSLFSDCSCSFARSCNIANTCTFAKTCTFESSCNVPNTCSVPATCERVKTCEQKVTIPDFDYGTFKGSVDVAIGNSGLEGGVDGQYCVSGGGCTTLAGGRIKVSSGKPEACVDIGGLGEFCAPF